MAAAHNRFGYAPNPSSEFPPEPQFSGFMEPCSFEGECRDLEVEGTIPAEIGGCFFRVMPNPQFPPYVENDFWFNGDGTVTAFSIKNGRVQMKQKWVRTEKFVREREAGKTLTGKYRNKHTDLVSLQVRTTANTNIFPWMDKLLAIKEDAHPYAMDPRTLDTIGPYDFDGQLPSTTFTAHPKMDAATGEMLCFGYEAKGDGTPDVCFYTVAPEGKFTQTVWFTAPVVGLMHDFAFTDNYVIFPIMPQLCDPARMEAGGNHWQWDTTCPLYIGVLPRQGATGADVKWYTHTNSFPGHTANAYEDSVGNILLDMPLSKQNVFFWWPDADGNAPDPRTIRSDLVRFTIDPKATELTLAEPKVMLDHDVEFPRIDDRHAGKPYRHVFMDHMDPSLGTDFGAIAPVMGAGYPPYNSLAHLDLQTGELEVYFPGRTHMCQEPVFIPSGSEEEGKGWLLVLVNNYATMGSELHLVDTENFGGKPVAVVKLPVRLRPGLHGNWVDAGGGL